MMKSKAKHGFTLAEVLVTIGIIGVVCSLTLPSLFADYSKKETVSKLKKNYYNVQNSMKKSMVANGKPLSQLNNIVRPYFNHEIVNSDVLLDYITANMKVSKKYYVKTGELKAEPKTMCLGNRKRPVNYANNAVYAFLGGENVVSNHYTGGEESAFAELIDGTCIGVMVFSYGWENVKLVIDINGSTKGPNMLGKDVFYFTISPNSSIKPFGEELPDNNLQATYTFGSCRTNAVYSAGMVCVTKIIRDGWKIKDDYPW